eukprot:CAMPEP_0170805438 /NCGR_PEP_ID=MMETSP0733-20121128/31372_1 /TAXON_ID=186038 /ORGANISM="Fragilariopsis kerguelensis, Strain L26-C5" /LENGTH=475 /DNA_ID=CAMNT_0011159823 /DNA_START=448 /DNA_END=1875 /DNA_ORIENTATION=+
MTGILLATSSSIDDDEDDVDGDSEQQVVLSRRSRLFRTLRFWKKKNDTNTNDGNTSSSSQLMPSSSLASPVDDVDSALGNSFLSESSPSYHQWFVRNVYKNGNQYFKKETRDSKRTAAKEVRRRRAARTLALSLASAGTICSMLGGGAVPPVYALTQQDMIEDNSQIYSLRPGISKIQAEQLLAGEMPDEIRDNIDAKSSIGSTGGIKKEDAIAQGKKGDGLYSDYEDDDDDDEYTEEERYANDAVDFGNENASSGTVLDPSKKRAASFATSSESIANTDVSSAVSKDTLQAFSGGKSRDKASKWLYVKVLMAVFTPTFGLFGVRDILRLRKEAKNVVIAMEITDAQRAEYMGLDRNGKNITASDEEEEDNESADSDVEDELKDLKNDNDDNDDDKNKDDKDKGDDDDDDDDDQPKRRKKRPPLPKQPQGDGGGGGSSGGDTGTGGGNSNDNGGGDDEGPSDEDIARLGNIFDKS